MIRSRATVVRFSPSDVCRVLGNRTIVFIRYSTIHQTASSLMNCLSQARRSCVSQLYFSRSNYLVYDANTDSKFHHYWESNPTDIIVLGRGPGMLTRAT